MAGPLGKPRDKADRPNSRSLRAAAECGACVATLLGIVGSATTFVAPGLPTEALIRIRPCSAIACTCAEAPYVQLLPGSGALVRKPP